VAGFRYCPRQWALGVSIGIGEKGTQAEPLKIIAEGERWFQGRLANVGAGI
jgi:hypothetical protein